MAEQDKDQVIKEQAAKILSLETELATTTAVNEGLVKQIEQGPSNTPSPFSEETFELDGKHIGFNYNKIVHKGLAITSAEVLASEDLQRELFNENSGMLKY